MTRVGAADGRQPTSTRPEIEDIAPAAKPGRPRGRSAAALVAAGILMSRLLGLVRERVASRYLGLSWQADAFNGAFRIPNFLQNLFGEGVLSASFIPAYASLLAQGDEQEAGRLAGAVLSLLALVISVLVLAGVEAAPLMVDAVAGGFTGERRILATRLVRVLFPGAGIFVLSAWCLGVLNSHRRFFLSYAAPVFWNLAMIATLLIFGRRYARDLDRAVLALAWGSVVGSALQFSIQFPTAARLVRHLRLTLATQSPHLREVVRNFVPVFFGRGVSQISAYVDAQLASRLPYGALTGLSKAQIIYMLPISLFGMAVSAAELPEMSSVTGGTQEIASFLQARLNAGMRRIAFFVVPSAAAFLALGDVIVGALLQTGRFGPKDTRYVWGILAGSAVGLLASCLGRLDASTYYALRDTRTPLRTAILRIMLTATLGALFAFPVPRWLGLDPKWGAAGLTASAGVAGWVEFMVLRGMLNRRIGRTGLAASFMLKIWGGAVTGTAVAWGLKLVIGIQHPVVTAIVVLGAYGGVYLGVTFALGVAEARALLASSARRLAGGSGWLR